MRRTRTTLCSHASALTVAGCLATGAFAGGISEAAYEFQLIAVTGGKDGLSSILSGSMNQNGQVVFDAMDADGVSTVYQFDGEAVSILVPVELKLDLTTDPVINDDDVIGFLGRQGSDPMTLFLYHPLPPGGFIVIDSFEDALAVGQLAINNAGDLAYWTLQCVSDCASLTHRIDLRPSGDIGAEEIVSTTASLGSPSSVSAPTINDTQTVVYRRVNEAGESAIELHDGAAQLLFEIESEGELSSPALNDGSTVAFYAADSSSAPGIYGIAAGEAPIRVVELDNGLVPSLFTGAALNNNDLIAFAATLDGIGEGIFITTSFEADATIEQVIAAGDDVDGHSVSGALQPLAFNDAGDILFKATVEGKSPQTVLVLARPVEIETCPGDFNGDDVVNVSDMLVLLGAWGPCDGCPEDLNNDGVVNVSDLLLLLGGWGGCE